MKGPRKTLSLCRLPAVESVSHQHQRGAYTEKGIYWVHIIRKLKSMAEYRG